VRRWNALDRSLLGVQLVRAAYSVGANIAEGSGRWHGRDRRQFLYVARGSLHETEHWILCAEVQGLLEPGTSDRVAEIAKPLNGLIRRYEG
jgi:four helix bundle protein